MVLGIRSKGRKNVAIPVEYLVQVHEIKPWPSPESQGSPQSVVFLQWENGNQPGGSITSEVGDGRIEFVESFRLPVTLIREGSKKSAARESYQKNMLEFFLYEPRKDKPAKGQLLGTAVINLADYGVTRETIAVAVPMSCKKLPKNSGQPVLHINIQQFGNDDDAEIAGFTDDDDDVSSHSSRSTTSSTQNSTKIDPEALRGNFERSLKESAVSSFVPNEKSMPVLKKSVTQGVRSSSSASGYQDNPPTWANTKLVDSNYQKPYVQESTQNNDFISHTSNAASSSRYIEEGVNGDVIDPKVTQEGDKKYWRHVKKAQEDAKVSGSSFISSLNDGNTNNQEHRVKNNSVNPKDTSDAKQAARSSQDSSAYESSANKLKHVKSVQLPSNGTKNNRSSDNADVAEKPRRADATKAAQDAGISKPMTVGKGKANSSSDSKGELESQIEMLKDELRESAAVEIGLYSVVAEHGSSANKMHAPARRLSRFYLHACKGGSKIKKASAARAAISGFILVSKACGNDVPRLTFWLSNLIMLRAIISQTIGKQHQSTGRRVNSNETGKISLEVIDMWVEPKKFMSRLQKLESWIFSRIVESVWWQTMTPHMHHSASKVASSSRKPSNKKNGLGDHEQGSFSIELWKKAFKDACERLCPARAGGHECGCLPVHGCLVLEQLVDRLDVAMFNAILRENGEEMPTDPVSDPISDSKVLPIPSGRSSFGAGVQLKNAIGNWSRCLTDIFDIDDGFDDKSDLTFGDKPESKKPFKAFRLLNALSDLMMTPFEMLADKSTRKEVCPSLTASLIKMILYTFVPDEFCPNPIPEAVFEALNSEDDYEVDGEESIETFPCTAKPTIYSPPSAASLASSIGNMGSQNLHKSGSSVLRKSYTSDDELKELDSPMSSIIKDELQQKRKSDRKVVRYELLREVWKDSEL